MNNIKTFIFLLLIGCTQSTDSQLFLNSEEGISFLEEIGFIQYPTPQTRAYRLDSLKTRSAEEVISLVNVLNTKQEVAPQYYCAVVGLQLSDSKQQAVFIEKFLEQEAYTEYFKVMYNKAQKRKRSIFRYIT
ncbi:hypothetical protein R9C00_10505 [Flammeovirgaceae bacterium SG7u.111]|nr:hypothetical protein [Flammeovirgaceae bacterium SG7u.132]WPO37884.1 hypothetical protein R9C00_10505 [Flammeovirgaceae bacterium SG7u.111]